ncbi:MAG TPA: RNA-binding protein [Vitreimonas sp.]|uniref:RNA-binding protein n=1 Tax=Vitreimonas sp. TaxID=3069702 RepID=UPI002D68DE43|nr:RNA-binding protein [Vitreimonas sp.]HYD87363.1 RNA-binding protein [Vitreimonas sp.]
MSPASSQIEAERPRRGRERRCIVSGESESEAGLVRFALAPDGMVTPDVAAKLPGRGAWVRADRTSIEAAAKKGHFARAFKAQVKVPDDLAGLTEQLLARRCLDQLGLTRRAGAIAIGATQVEAAIRAKPAFLLLEAKDGAEEGREKLMSLHIGLWRRPPPTVGCFASEELGVALGRERVIHACLLQERLAMGWAAEIARLAGFRAIVPASWPASWRSVSWKLGGADAGANQGRDGRSDIDEPATKN